jgi:hypothetical protein
MNLDDLKLLAGVAKSADTPVQEQPQLGDMRTLIALVTPEQLNQLQSSTEEAVEEEGFANSGDEYAGEPEEYKGTLGSPADLSLRRYLGANGMPVNVDEAKVYEDHKVEDITEAYAQYKAEQNQVVAEAHACGCDDSCSCGGNCGPNCNCHSGCSATNESVTEGHMKDEMIDDAEKMSKSAFIKKYGEENAGTWESVNESLEEGKVGTPNSLEKVEAQIEKLKDMAKKARADGDPQKANDIESSDEMTELLRKQKKLKKNESIEEAVVDEDDVEEDNAFNSAAANAKKAGKKSFSFNGKTYPVKMDAKTADGLTDDIDILKQLAGI